jgi:hypothetical protein
MLGDGLGELEPFSAFLATILISRHGSPIMTRGFRNRTAKPVYVGVSLPATVTLTPPERASPMRLARS